MPTTVRPEFVEILEKIVRASDVTFDRLAKLAELNPELDFRFADLTRVDLRGADIRGFDFTGSDLSWAIKDSKTIIDETTIFQDAELAWIESEEPNIVNKMLEIQNANNSQIRRQRLSELQEHYRSADHILQFLVTSMQKSKSIEAFFDFANSIHSNENQHANSVILSELNRIVDTKSKPRPKRRKTIAQSASGLDLILKLLEESINPTLRGVAAKVFTTQDEISQSRLLEAIRGVDRNLL